MMSRCLYCYKELEHGSYHPSCSKKLFGTAEPPKLEYTLEGLYQKARESIISSAAVPGVQPKMSMAKISQDGTDKLTFVGLWGDYIIKPPAPGYEALPENEAATMKMADAAGIAAAPSALLPLASGELVYITLRMDRAEIKSGRKISRMRHMEDFCQATEHMTENKYIGSMELVAKTLRRFSSAPGLDLSVLLDITLFIFLTGNGDMHLKNFSLLHENGERRLAPAYDMLSTRLVISEKDDPEEFALTINGKKSNLKPKDFIKFAESAKLNEKQYNNAAARLKKRLPDILETLDASFLPDKQKKEYAGLIMERAARLEILP